MNRWRFSQSPGMTHSPDDVITIRCLAPTVDVENVELRVLELSEWQYLRRNMSEMYDPYDHDIATFTGTLRNRRFEVADMRHAWDAGDDDPAIKVKFHGSDTVYDLHVPRTETRFEGAELEIGFRVRGEIHRHGRIHDIHYRHATPTFMRNPGANHDPARPHITFITGNDRFQRAARQYWRGRSDAIIARSSIEGILRFLRSQQNIAQYGEGKWGEVNIVSHANSHQWILKLFQQPNEGPRAVDVNVLERVRNDARLEAPGEDVLDANSRIVIRGCSIGDNQDLLDAIRRLFGDRAVLYAPKYVLRYEWQDYGGRRHRAEYFLQSFGFYVPGSRSPCFADCLRRMQEEHAREQIEEGEWRRLLNGVGQRVRKDSTEVFRFTVEYGANEPPSDEAAILADLRRNWPGGARTYHTQVADWQWSFQPSNHQQGGTIQHDVVCTGRRRCVEVRRPYVGTLFADVTVPNLYAREHFGRSPFR